jgi:arylsulfatase A-like enzyme
MWWFPLLACHAPTSPPDTVTEPGGHSSPTDTAGTTDGPLAFSGPRPKNLLMISIDTTRRDHFGTYSSTVYTPWFADFMGGAVTLDDHQQCSDWTYASTSCTLLGRYHEENGFAPELRAGTQPFPDGQVTLARRLHDHGYWSTLLSPNSWLGTKWNNAQGYDDPSPPGTGRAREVLELGRRRVQDAIAQGHDRWFLHVHLMEPHAPYVPPAAYYEDELVGVPPLPEGWNLDSQDEHYAIANRWPALTTEEQALLERHLRARYHGELRFLDEQVAEQMALFDEAGLLDDALVVVWTDHGEQFYERGRQSHAWFLNAEENDAVLLFWAKNLAPLRWTEPTHAVDLVPTVLDALGYSTNDPTLSGHVLGAAPPGRPRFGMSVARGGVLQSVTVDDRKLVFDWDGRVTAWDRAADRSETVDVFDAQAPADLERWNLLLPHVLALRELQPDETFVWPAGLPHP